MEEHAPVTDQDELERLCRNAAGSDWLGVDTEFVRESTYYPQLCLIQIATDDMLAAVDPLAGLDLSPLHALFQDPGIIKVMHAARQDLEVLSLDRDEIPGPIFDTQIAAGLAGFGDQPGYANLVQAALGYRLGKGETRTDWSRRPLHPDQLSYALDDVRHLGALYRTLTEQLSRKGRERWLEAEFEALADPGLYRVEPADAWRRVKGVRQMDARQRAALKRLAAWRETEAREKDRPRGWILKDDALVAIAQSLPSRESDLDRIRNLPPRTRERHATELVRLVQAGVAAAGDEGPETRLEPLTPDQAALADLAMMVLKSVGARQDIAPQALATRKEVEKLVRGERDLPVLKGWRREAVGSQLLDLLAGKLTVGVEDGQVTIGPR